MVAGVKLGEHHLLEARKICRCPADIVALMNMDSFAVAGATVVTEF